MVLKKKRAKKNLNGASDGDEHTPGLRNVGDLKDKFLEHMNFSTQQNANGAVSASDLPELRTCLKQLTQKLGSLRTSADGLAQRLAGKDSGSGVPTGSAAYMDMKVQMMLSYITGLTYYVLLKTRGVPVRDHQLPLRLMWLRTLLEKIKPVDQRLQYQINKLLQAAEAKANSDAGAKSADPRALRPGDLALTVEDEESGEDAEEAAPAEEDDGIYKPPRISQVEYTGDHITSKEKAEREFDRQKKRFEQSDMVRSLREEFTDAPAEIRAEQRSIAVEKAQRKMREQLEYEEENMVRLRATKTEKKEKQRLFKAQRSHSGGAVSLEDAADFNDLASALSGGGGKGKGKGGKGKGRRRDSGNALQGFLGAGQKLRDASNLVDSVSGGRMPEHLGSFKRGSGGGMGGGKRRRQ